jgi:hypothetical protein
MLVGIVGFISCGKGTVGEIFVENGFIRDSFAKPVKDAVSVMFGWPRELLEGDTDYSRKWREEPDIFWSEKFGRSFSPREALQLMGTEAGRETFHHDLWVISLLNRSKGKDVVVTDVRFKNEIEYIQKNEGIVIRVKRGEDPEWFDLLSSETDDFYRQQIMKGRSVHRSEWDWVGCDFDYVIENNTTIQNLRQKVVEVLQLIK